MSILNRISRILIFLVIILMLTGGTKIKLQKGWAEVSQVDPWMWILAGLTFLQWKLSPPSWPNLPLVKFLTKAVNVSARQLMPQRFLVLVLLGFAAIAAAIHSFRLYQMTTGYEDHGVIQQVLMSSWLRAPFQCEPCLNGSYLGDHLAFTLLFVAPILGIFQKPEVLFVIQSVILAAGAFFLIRLGPLHQRRDLWGLALLIVLCHPHFRHTWYLIDFREDHLAFLFLALSGIGIIQQNRVLFVVAAILSALSKENIGLILPMVCLVGFLLSRSSRLQSKTKRLNLIYPLAFAASLVWVILTFKVFMPHFQGGAQSQQEIAVRLSSFGKTPTEILTRLISHPIDTLQLILADAAGSSGRRYLGQLLIPWILFTIRGWPWLLAALPGIAMNLISSKLEQRSLQWHYELIIYPFLILALLEGIRRSRKKDLLVGLFIALAFSGRWPLLDLREHWPTQTQWESAQWLSSIPKDGILTAEFALLGPAATRAEILPIRSFQSTTLSASQLKRTKWILLDLQDPTQKMVFEQRTLHWVVHSRSPEAKSGDQGRYVLLGQRSIAF